MMYGIRTVHRKAVHSLPALLLLLLACVAGQVPQTHDCPDDAEDNPTLSLAIAPSPVLAEGGKQLEVSCSYEACPHTTEFDLRWKKDEQNVYAQKTFGDQAGRVDKAVLAGVDRNLQRSPRGVDLIIPEVAEVDVGEYCCDITLGYIALSEQKCTQVKYYDRGTGLQVKDDLGQTLTTSASYQTEKRDVSFSVTVTGATPAPAITVHQGDEEVDLEGDKLVLEDLSGSVMYEIRLAFHGKVVETFQLPITYTGAGVSKGVITGVIVALLLIIVLVAAGLLGYYKMRQRKNEMSEEGEADQTATFVSKPGQAMSTARREELPLNDGCPAQV